MTKVIDVDKLLAFISTNQRDEVTASSITPQPGVTQPTPTVVTQPSVAPAPSGPLGSKTNPFKMNKLSNRATNAYIPENSPNDGRGSVGLPVGAKVYFEVDPIGTLGGTAFAMNIKFYFGAGTVCKLTQDKRTGVYSPEACQGSDGFLDIVYNGQPDKLADKKFLYAIVGSPDGPTTYEVWAVLGLTP